MDEGSGYCGSGVGIESVSDAAKIANMVMKGTEEESNLFRERQCIVNMKPRFLAERLGIMGLVVGREKEELTILEVC